MVKYLHHIHASAMLTFTLLTSIHYVTFHLSISSLLSLYCITYCQTVFAKINFY